MALGRAFLSARWCRGAKWRIALLKLALAVLIGVAFTAVSAMWGHTTVLAAYPDILGCEHACRVVASGVPIPFIRDYPGMSVVHVASWTDVVFAADRFDGASFLGSAAIWATASYLTLLVGARHFKARHGGRE